LNPAGKGPRLRRFILLISYTLLLALALGSLYQFIEHRFLLTDWIAAAWVNAVLAVVVVSMLSRNELWQACRINQSRLILALAPAVFWMGGAFFLTRLPGALPAPQMSGDIGQQLVALVMFIPFVEELVFRVGLGGFLRRIGGNLWGGYFSAVLFSLAHSFPTWERLMGGQSGLVLGPLVLGIFLEWLWIKTGNFWAIWLFHAAANSTIFIFGRWDTRWFQWLDFLFS